MATPTSTTPWKFSTDSGNARIDALLGGTQWSGSSLTYSFPDTSSTWSTSASLGYDAQTTDNEPWSVDFDTLATSDRADARRALEAWADVIGLTFTEVTDNASVVGDIRMAYTHIAETADAQAWAYLPGSGPIAGDVWFNTDSSQYTAFWDDGSYEYQTVLHELGHALGLKHPFEGDVTLDPSLDSRSYTLMSYSADPGNQNTYFSFEPTTPMILDIAAVQHLYGANTNKNKGDTTYTFGDATTYHETLWDAGGVDLIQYTGSRDVTIDLVAGVNGGSTIGLAVNVVNQFGSVLYAVDNLWIADGVTIENATAGSGDDDLFGNAAANALTGGGGTDSLSGAGGSDTLDGGGGIDTLAGGQGNDIYIVNTTKDVVNETPTDSAQIDTVKSTVNWTLGPNLEKLTLTGTAVANATGNDADNTLRGNSAANVINGTFGADTMTGGGGSDTYFVDDTGDVVEETSTSAADVDKVNASITWSLGSGQIEQLTLVGSSAINGTGNQLDNTLVGNGANNVLNGGGGSDTLTGGAGSDIFQLAHPSSSDADRITDFVSGTDDLRVNQATIRVGDGDTVVDGAVRLAGPGGFSASAELVIITGNISGTISTSSAAAAIGSANGNYAVGATRLFVVDNGSDSRLYLFTADDANAVVSASELQLLATLSGQASLTTGDVIFSG